MGKFKKYLNEAKKIKISVKFWNKLKDFEKEYIKQRVHSGKDDISGVKLKINM